MLVGGAFYGYVVAETASMVTAFDANNAEFFKKIDMVRSWMDHHGFPNYLRRKVRRSYKVFYTNHMALNEDLILEDLEPALQEEVADFLLPPDVKDVPLFQNLPMGAKSKLVSIMRTIEVDPHTVIVTEGEPSNAMFIVTRGVCACQHGDDKSFEVREGDSFGERALLGVHPLSDVTVTTGDDFCELIVFPEAKFIHEFADLPEVLELMKRHSLLLRKVSTGSSTPKAAAKKPLAIESTA